MAQLCVAFILYLSVIIPMTMRWLAGKTHELVRHHGWGERSMGKVTNLLYGAFSKVQQDGSLLLKYDFIMIIFGPLYAQLPEVEDCLNYYKETVNSDSVELGLFHCLPED
jgi:hypothetical protein